jgi:hypothetical protein
MKIQIQVINLSFALSLMLFSQNAALADPCRPGESWNPALRVCQGEGNPPGPEMRHVTIEITAPTFREFWSKADGTMILSMDGRRVHGQESGLLRPQTCINQSIWGYNCAYADYVGMFAIQVNSAEQKKILTDFYNSLLTSRSLVSSANGIIETLNLPLSPPQRRAQVQQTRGFLYLTCVEAVDDFTMFALINGQQVGIGFGFVNQGIPGAAYGGCEVKSFYVTPTY